MGRRQSLGDRGAFALAALALAVQVSLPLLLAIALHIDSHGPPTFENAPTASAAADQSPDAANPLAPGHHCSCPVCEILAVSQCFALVAHPVLTVLQPAPHTLIALESAPLLPVSFPSSYQARAPPLAG